MLRILSNLKIYNNSKYYTVVSICLLATMFEKLLEALPLHCNVKC